MNHSSTLDPIRHDHLLHRHHPAYGLVVYWRREQEWIKIPPNHPSIPSFLRELVARGGEIFLTANQFHPWRRVQFLRSLRACFVDLDHPLLEPEPALWGILEFCGEEWIPEPSLAVFSGRGLHLYWLLRPVPARALPLWQRVQDQLIHKFRPFGADPAVRDCTRVLRLVGSRTKDGGIVTGCLLFDPPRYWTLREIADRLLEERPRRSRKGRSARSVKAGRRGAGIYGWWYLVYQDLLTIAAHHRNRIPEGYRDKWLFLASVALSWFLPPERLQVEITAHARQFTTLPLQEAHRSMKAVVERALKAKGGEEVAWEGRGRNPRYWFRRETLVEWLGDLIPAELAPRLRALAPEEVIRGRKGESWRSRWEDRYTGSGYRLSNTDKFVQARLLRAKGWSCRRIAEELGVNERTIRRWCEGEGGPDSV